MNKQLVCQHPVVKGIVPKCEKLAIHHNSYGWVFCEDHKEKGDTKQN